jgi:hypothetical protein
MAAEAKILIKRRVATRENINIKTVKGRKID